MKLSRHDLTGDFSAAILPELARRLEALWLHCDKSSGGTAKNIFTEPFMYGQSGGKMSKIDMRKAKPLLDAKTPLEYIDRSIKVKLSATEKAAITRLWLEKRKDYTIKDIEYARNRHPYWKAKKTDNSLERTKLRYQRYSHLANDSYRKKWTEAEIELFLEHNSTKKDFELAEMLSKTIPSIQSYRRKLKLIEKIKKNRRNIKIREFIELAEKVLFRQAKEIEEGTKKAKRQAR